MSLYENWRGLEDSYWLNARWLNGMEVYRYVNVGKTVVCGHWHTSFGHSRIENSCPEFGDGADFSPFYDGGIIAVDGCTAYSGIVNCVVLEDGVF